jgi:hypothetical protein
MKTILLAAAAVITMFAGFEVYSISTEPHGTLAAQRTTANSILDEALAK